MIRKGFMTSLLLALSCFLLLTTACGIDVGSSGSPSSGGKFSLDHCDIPEIDIPLNKEGSRAHQKPGTRNLGSGELIDAVGTLVCKWEKNYQSANKVGIIQATVDMTWIKDETQARKYFTENKLYLSNKPGYCEDDYHCYVTSQHFSPDRMFYSEENDWGTLDGDVLPSYHYAGVMEIIPGDGGFYVLEINVDHPELNRGNQYVGDKAILLETYFRVKYGDG